MDTVNTAYHAGSPIHPSLEPVQHLSEELQRKLLKRATKQCKHFRSSGKPIPACQKEVGSHA